MNQIYERAWKGIISPNKFTHRIQNLCPKQQIIDGKILERIDFNFQNSDNKMISGVILKQQDTEPERIILYLHGNGGSKLECLGFVPYICKNKIAVIGFDFIGCGNSDHGFLTYGINQSKDAQAVLKEAEKYIKIKRLTIWGRSMGAATAIILAERKKIDIDSLVLDCPFHNLLALIGRVIKYQTQLPHGFCKLASYILSQDINDKLNVKVFGIDYLGLYRKAVKTIPTLFIYSQKDNLVPKQEVFAFYNVCKAHKNLIQIGQQHEQQRNPKLFEQGIHWLRQNPNKRSSKLKLLYMTDGLEIDYSSVKIGRGFCCCTRIN